MRKFLYSLRWKAKQLMAGDSRYYGDGGTIHHNGYLDVETYQGQVVSVWFRCQPLSFKQTEVDWDRAQEMKTQYQNYHTMLTGVEVQDVVDNPEDK